MIVLKTILFSLLAPGTVVGVVPYLLLTRGPALPVVDPGWLRYFGALPIAVGLALFISSAWNFVSRGRGTPAPIDPPIHLVASGPYRVVRNPMYAGGVFILSGEVILSGSLLLLCYAFVVWTAFHLFTVLYEEPHLTRLFGASYRDYCREVPRWTPRVGRMRRSRESGSR